MHELVSPTRRDFLRSSLLTSGALALGLAPAHGRAATPPRQAILLWLTGGPSALDTWDPKPDAPLEIRGPFQTVATRTPGLRFTELFPGLAERSERLAVIRSLTHDAAPIHESGQQLLQTGLLHRPGQDYPHLGAVVTHLRGPGAHDLPGWCLLPGPLGDTGVSVGHGQTAGPLGAACEPGRVKQQGPAPERYGGTAFGRSCYQALRLIEAGVHVVAVNMFTSVYHGVSWDCHADGGMLATTLDDYRREVGPTFDHAVSALLDDLVERGLWNQTLVAAVGEFGRTPRINSLGGRDHWTGAWTGLLAGGGIRGGQVVGATDRVGGEVRDRPVQPAEWLATLYQALGIDPHMPLTLPDGRTMPLARAEPIAELF